MEMEQDPGKINYQELYNMITSSDPEAKKIGLQAARNLTIDEAKEFASFQTSLHQRLGEGSELTRQDNSFLGVDPGLAAVGALKLPGMAASAMKGSMSGLGETAKEVGKWWAIMKGLDMVNMPSEAKTALLFGLGLKGGSKGKAAPTAVASEEAMIREQLAKQGYRPELIEEVVARSKGLSMPPREGPPRPPIQLQKPGADDIAENVKRGVQNDFRGRVSIQPQGAYSPNVSTESSLDDIIEMLTRSSSSGQPSPMMFHDSAPQGMRQSVDKLKRNVARRKPR
jgi:hypothetical protein